MRTENSKHGVVSIMLVFALVFSMISITSFASSGDLISTPTEVSVLSGGTFVISQRLVWDEVDDGQYIVTIYWEAIDNKPSENFTFLSAEAYFDNLDPIEAWFELKKSVSPSTGNLLYILGVRNTVPDPRNGEFNVDITLRASGAGGVPHAAGDHLIEYSMIVVSEDKTLTFYPDPVTVHVGAWLSGTVVKGTELCYAIDVNLPPPFVLYEKGDFPPIAAAQRIGDGAVYATGDTAGISGSVSGAKYWMHPENPDPHDPELLHAAMQWMVSDAKDVLWYEGYDVHKTTSYCQYMVDNLTALGYTITGDSTEPISAIDLSPYDILFLPGLQLGDWHTGGDPSLLPGSDVAAIVSFVEGGGGLIIMECADYAGASFGRVQNKILKALGFDWCFQSDTLYAEPPDNYFPYGVKADVDTTTTIGAMYQSFTGKTTVGLYSPTSLTEWPVLGVTVDISPGTRAAENGVEVKYTVTVRNTGEVWDKFALSASDVPFNWNPTLDKDSTGFIENNTSTTATLTVTIPGGAAHCNLDTITVTATSYWDDTVSGSDTCTAHCTVGIKVDVEMLEPKVQEGYPLETLHYKAAIKNVGVEDDTYTVSISDTKGWGLELQEGLDVKTKRIYPSDDIFVRENKPDVNLQVDEPWHAYHFYVGMYYDQRQWTYLKFDLSDLPVGAEISSATLNLNAQYGPSGPGYVDENLWVNAENVSDDTWDETTITWSTAPPMGPTVLDSVKVRPSGEVGEYAWWSWDVTSYIQAEYASDKTASIGMRAENEELNVSVWFYSKDDAFHPYLEVTYPEIYPSDDAYVTSWDEDWVTGVPPEYHAYHMYVGAYYKDGVSPSRAYLKFDLSDLPVGAEISSATLNLNAKYGPSDSGYVDENLWVNAVNVSDDTWDETTIAWINAPPMGPTVLDSVKVRPSGEVGEYAWWSWDVTSYIQAEYAGDKTASIGMRAANEELDVSVWFYSKDDTFHPYLEVTYNEITVPAGENRVIDFYVTIPMGTLPFEDDIITVTAVSETSPDVSDSDSCTAHNAGLRSVEVVISEDQDGYRDPLTYIVVVKNTGILNDKYNLTATSELGWPLHIEPQEIWLKPDHVAQAALSVTIPAQTEGDAIDTITVEAVGNLSSGSFTDPYDSWNIATVTARCEEVLGVDVEVYPSIHQTGHPGSELTWLVTVTNTGNVSDNYNLSLSQDVDDKTDKVYDDWEGGFEPGLVSTLSVGPLGQGKEESILLVLDIPGDLRTGVQNLIKVDVESETKPEISDIENVTAQVLELKPRIPQGEIQLQAVAGIIAIDIWQTEWDFEVLNEMESASTPTNYFTVRNVGNVDVTVWIEGTDAVSKPGEPAAEWTLSDGVIGVNTYAMWRTKDGDVKDTVTTKSKLYSSRLEPHDERYFGLKIRAPSTFTAPAKMWMKVMLTARKI